MTSAESEIYHYLKSHPERFTPVQQICRHAAGRKRYRREPEWAVPVLAQMQEQGIVESEDGAAFRLSRDFLEGLQARRKRSRWIAPQLKQMLGASKALSSAISLENPDEVEWNYLFEHNGVPESK